MWLTRPPNLAELSFLNTERWISGMRLGPLIDNFAAFLTYERDYRIILRTI